MDLSIRIAEVRDIPMITEFNRRMAAETEHRSLTESVLAEGVRAIVTDAGKGIYFVAEAEGTVVGQLMITYEWSDWRNGTFWWIQSVYVDQAWRGKGVFRSLYQHVLEEARADRGVCGLRLYVEANNRTAIRTYETLGMKRTEYVLYEQDFVLSGAAT